MVQTFIMYLIIKKLYFEKNKSLIPNFIGNTDIKIIPMMAGENVYWSSKIIE